MTTGSIGGLPSDNSNGFYKAWSGADGKYETVGFRRRFKWNNYTLDRRQIRDSVRCPLSGQYLIDGTVPPPWNSLWSSNDDLALQSKLVSAVKGHDFNLAVNAAQGALTVRLVVDNLSKLGRSILALKHGNFSSAARQLGANPRVSKLKAKDISGRWLELQYGWLPLLGDTFEAAKALEAISNGPRSHLVTVKKSKKGKYEASGSNSLYSVPGNWIYSKKILYEMQEEISIARSLGLLDPLSVIWEIIPYSFVVDWFIPIGSYLEVLAAAPQLRGRLLTTVSRYADADSGIVSGAGNPHYNGGRQHYIDLKVDRTSSVGLSVALPSFKSVPSAMSPRHIWNAIALAHQRFR